MSTTYDAMGRRIALRSGGTVLELGTVGASIASLRVGGVDLVEPTPRGRAPYGYNGVHLAPWPNRVRDGRWTFEGEPQQLDITEPDRHTALHGLVAYTDFEVRELADDAATLGVFVPPQHGWPVPLDVEVRFTATGDGMRAEHRVTNLGALRAPYATSAHPYLRIGAHPVETLTISVPSDTRIEVDDRLNPTGLAPVEGTPFDLRHGPLIGDLDLDTAYAEVRVTDGVGAVLASPDGARLEVLQDDDWAWVQVFTTTIWPGDEGPRWAVAVEPMTAPPDALNSGDGLVWLDPEQSWSGSWGLRYRPADRAGARPEGSR